MWMFCRVATKCADIPLRFFQRSAFWAVQEVPPPPYKNRVKNQAPTQPNFHILQFTPVVPYSGHGRHR
jgi:hypothetical protein